MQKEKKVRTYQRRTKSGKMVTVRAHTAKYDAAEEAKELAKKKGSGDELEMRKRKLAMEQLAGKKAADILEEKLKEKKEKESEKEPKEEKKSKKKGKEKLRPVGSGTNGPRPKKEKSSSAKSSEPAFTVAEYKQWYHWDQDADPNNKAAKKVAKALRAQMGRAGYNKYFNEMTDKYSPRGHISAYKNVSLKMPDTSKTSKPEKQKSEKTLTQERRQERKEMKDKGYRWNAERGVYTRTTSSGREISKPSKVVGSGEDKSSTKKTDFITKKAAQDALRRFKTQKPSKTPAPGSKVSTKSEPTVAELESKRKKN